MNQKLIFSNKTFRDISTRAFQLSLKDGRDIRSRYIKAKHVSFYKAEKLSKNDMIEIILQTEFAPELVDEYLENVKVWRKYEQQAIEDWLQNIMEEKETTHE
jgi:endo-1,4-beta-mannosidase